MMAELGFNQPPTLKVKKPRRISGAFYDYVKLSNSRLHAADNSQQ